MNAFSLSRRSFLGGVLTVVASSVLPIFPAHSLPILYGNGEDDDAPALNALLRGDPFVAEDNTLSVTRVNYHGASIQNGLFAVGSPLVAKLRVYIAGSYFKVLPGFPRGQPVLDLRHTPYFLAAGNFFDGTGGRDLPLLWVREQI